MATLKPELKTILDRYGIDPRDRSQVWDCHGVLVLYHKAYEIIAAKEKIAFDPPTVIEGSSERKTVALLVVGRIGDRAEWSIGEAAPGNNKNTYPYAMAEKRAKDRVIAKLVGLSAYIHSEDEAEDFKDAKPETPQSEAPATLPPPPPSNPIATFWAKGKYTLPADNQGEWVEKFVKAVATAPDDKALDALILQNQAMWDGSLVNPKYEGRLKGAVDERRDYLANPPRQAAE